MWERIGRGKKENEGEQERIQDICIKYKNRLMTTSLTWTTVLVSIYFNFFLNKELFENIIKLSYIPKFDNTITMREIKPTLLDIFFKNLRYINNPRPKKKTVIWTINNYTK